MRIAFYANERDNQPEIADLDWPALVQLLTYHTRTPCNPCPGGRKCEHKKGRAWSPVEIDGPRRNENVKAITVAVFDLDHASFAEVQSIAARIESAGLAAILHSSHSHKPPEDCCARLVLPLSRPVLAAEIRGFRARVAALYSLPVDRSTKDESRLYYLPTAPEGSEVLAGVTEGAALNVDAILALPGFENVEKSPKRQALAGNAPEIPTEAIEIDMGALRTRLRILRDRYKARANPDERERAEVIDRVLKGEPLAQEGSRDATLNQICSIMVTALHPQTPIAALLEILRPSVLLMPGDPPDCGDWLEEARDMIERARERRAQNDAAKRDWDRQLRERLMRDSALADGVLADEDGTDEEGDPEAANDDEPPPVAEYTDEQIAEWAEQQNTTPEAFEKRWIIQRGKAFYVFVGGRYRAPITKDDLPVSLPRDLARAPVTLVAEDKDGNERPLPLGAILDRYATVARQVSASLALQRSFYDARTETFFEAVCPIRAIRPKEHPEIHRWLELLGGDQSARLLDWVASAPRLDRQACAIYLDGPKGCGKSLLANGIARLWTPGGPSELARVLSGFNDVLTSCPLIFADESLPQQKGITAELRRLIGSTSRNLNRKFMPACNLDGAVRLIIAGNNDRVLDSGEDLSNNDIDAVASRFLYIQAPQAAADYLASLGGPPVVGKWITDDMIAAHALFLRETRHVHEGSRFLVEGITQEFHNSLAIGSGLANLVCEWLVRYLCDPETAKADHPEARKNLVLAGRGEVWVNADALVAKQAWEKRVPSVQVPSATKIGRALRNLAIGSERVKVGERQHKYHRINTALLLAWAERSTVVDGDTLNARINGPCDLLERALRVRQSASATA